MVVPMEQWAGQPFQDKSADLWVVMLSDHNEKYTDRMERSYRAFAVTFELRFPFPLKKTGLMPMKFCRYMYQDKADGTEPYFEWMLTFH